MSATVQILPGRNMSEETNHPAAPKAIFTDVNASVYDNDLKKVRRNRIKEFPKKEMAATTKKGRRIMIGKSTIDTGRHAATRIKEKKKGSAR